MADSFFKDLNTAQTEAVKHSQGPSVILAGAGSGKTRVLVSKVVHLIKNLNTPPSEIVMITFTNKAANEMKERIARAFPLEKRVRLGYIGTFHSFCCQILRRDGEHIGLHKHFVIYDGDDQQTVLKSVLKKLDIKRFTPSYFAHRISEAKNQLVLPERYLSVFSDYTASLVGEVYTLYQKELKKNRAVDFDDLILYAVQLFLKNGDVLENYQDQYKYILVDEFQDTNYAQFSLTRLLGSKYKNVTVVGDFSQSIYSWRGADIRNMEKFQQDFPDSKIFYLEVNYRSTQSILDYAYKVISKNQTHPILKLRTANDKGEEVYEYDAENEEEEAVYVANEIERLLGKESSYGSFAVLYRTNAQSRAIEEAFLHYGVPYTLIGGTRFYERKEIKDVLSYLRLMLNPVDSVAQERLIKLGKRKWSQFQDYFAEKKDTWDEKSTVELMEEIFNKTGYLDMYIPDDEEDYARLENIRELKSVAFSFPKLPEFLEQVALVESEYFQGEKKGNKEDRVKLMTLHQAKGLEFPYVFIVGVEEGILPHARSIDNLYQLEEERRLFYVGLTRARKKLYLTYARRRFIFGRRGDAAKSRFLGEEGEENYNF